MKIVMDEFRWNVAQGPDQTKALMMVDKSGTEIHVLLSDEDAKKVGQKLSGSGLHVAHSAPKGIVGPRS